MNKQELPEVLFLDLDDTIISFDGVSQPAWEYCSKDLINKFHTDFTIEELLSQIEQTKTWYWGDADRHRKGRANLPAARREVVTYALSSLGIHDEERILYLSTLYDRIRHDMIHLFENSLTALDRFKRAGLRMALITNGSSAEQREKIDRFRLEGYFEQVFIEGEVGYGKPDPRIFERAMDVMETRPQHAWMVGDNLVWDVGAPKELGIYSIWNDWRRQGLPENSSIVPDRTINEIMELI